MTKYLRYIIKNIEPMRITNDSSSQNGQADTLRYIPGTSIRGMVINAFLEFSDFEEKKAELFSEDVKFLNAYPLVNNMELIPSPKGFYESKIVADKEKEIQNYIAREDFERGYKRAALGEFSCWDKENLYYYSVNTSSDMKIKINAESEKEKTNVFRNEYIIQDQFFCGYIAVENIELLNTIQKIFEKKNIIIGNSKFNGLGKCEIVSSEIQEDLPYHNYLLKENTDHYCYLYLLSNMTMRDEFGEYCGINKEKLEEKMNVENLEIERAATSIIEVNGYNRKWGCKVPSVKMYEKGSIFRLTFKGSLNINTVIELCNNGIGVRKNEGFGRILFLKDYEKVNRKSQIEVLEKENSIKNPSMEEDEKVLKQVAKQYYRNKIYRQMEKQVVKKKMDLKGGSKSQIGVLESLVIANQYNPMEAKISIENYFHHAQEKEDNNKVQKKRNSMKGLNKTVCDLLNMDKQIEEILEIFDRKNTFMGFEREQLLTKEEELSMKLDYLIKNIRFNNRLG